jgi:hypothetical protein
MSRGRSSRGRIRTGRRALAVAVAGLLVTAAAAWAAVGLTNPSFEAGLDGWTAQIFRADTEELVSATDCAGIGGDAKRAICTITGQDTFTPTGGSPITVTPLDGNRMVRLGGPFTSSGQNQLQDRYELRQTFTVDAANPVIQLNYNVFLFDYSGFDTLNFVVSLTDQNGDAIASLTQGGFGPGGNTSLKNTGWRSAHIDLSDYAGQQVHLLIDSGGTEDNLYGFWAYVDAGQAPVPPVSPPTFNVPTNPATGQPVPVNNYSDPISGQTFIAIPNAQTSDFPDGCVGPIPISVPIAAGNGTVSNVSLLVDTTPIPMSEGPPGIWNATIDCAGNYDLAVQYTLTEGGESESFIVPIGGIALIDPAGIVYDQAKFDAAKAAGQSDEQARAGAAIQGATVRLQRKVGDTFKNVLSGDPGISPNVNPEVTGANGQFQWLTDEGDYRVVVSKDGYNTAISREVTIPPEVTDLHVGLTKPGTAPPPPPPPPPPPAVTPPPPPAPPKKACASLKGKKLAACKRREALKKATNACKAKHKGKKNAKKRALCIKRAKALSKCSAITGKKNAKKKKRCIAAARRIGTKAKK